MSQKYISIGEHHFELPALPKKEDILFINEKDPYWRRDITGYRDIWFDFVLEFTRMDQDATLYNRDGILESLNTEDSKYIRRIYEQENKRRRDGIWFKNGSDIEYITGSHYFLLQWSRMQRHDGKGDYADYREFQRDYFYLVDHAKKSKSILGLAISKPKKTGITNLHWSGYYLNKATMTKNKNMGAMSTDQGQAAKTFRDYFLYSYNGLPNPLRPAFKNKSENDGTIIFGRAYNNSKKNIFRSTAEDELNTNVFCVGTEEKAFDVAVMDDAWYDEYPKTKKPFGEIWRTNKEAVKIQSKINGKNWLTSYTPENDTQSFRDAREIFFDSELKTRLNGEGATRSELICWHIPAYAAWEGAFNKNGKCNEKQAATEIEAERNKVKSNRRSYQAIIRQYANDKREAWASSGAGSTFDNVRLGDLLADLEIDQRDATENKYIEGRLEWKNSLWEAGLKNKRPLGHFGDGVKFVPLTDEEKENGIEGRLRIYHFMPESHQNAVLKLGRDEYEFLLPPDRFIYVGGIDPTNYAAGSEVTQGSKNAFYTMNMPDDKYDRQMGKVATKVFMAEYFYRPELPNEAYEDMVKQVIFFGMLSLVEGNASYFATRMMQDGLGHYMIVKDKDGLETIWKPYMGLPADPEKKYKFIRMVSNSAINKDMMETLVRVYKNYIEKPTHGEKDYGSTMKSERHINQMMNVDVTDTRLSDLFMAGGYTLWAVEIYLDYLLHVNDDYNEDGYVFALSALSQD